MNSAAINICVQVSVWMYVFISPRNIPRSRIAHLQNFNLKSIIIGNGVTKLPNGMLWVVPNIENITVKGKITSIESEAFKDCPKLNSLNMDWSNVINIGDKAFENCSSLSGKIKLNPACAISETAFNNCKIQVTK